ncbi:hypothetical protein KY284_003998 [Solanum tuberosum]|nr:hypothetical protein KY284_003998 [Solanum tuberosum]
MPKVKRFKNPLKVANGRASSSTTPAAQTLPDASTIPSQAHEEQAPILLQEEQALIPLQQEQAPILPQQEQVHILPSNSSVPLMNQRIYSKYWNVDARDSENAIKQIHVKANERWSGPLGMPKKHMEDRFETILKEISRRNKEIQKMQKMPHTGGSKANSRRRHELFLETGKTPSRAKMFIETHKRRNGSFVNDEARTIGEQIELNMTQGDTNETKVSPNDTIGKMLEAEHFGRDYMISKDGGVPEQFSTLFSPQPELVDSENDPVSPVDNRGSSVDNNTN